MKKLNYLLSMLVISAMVVFSGCSDDGDEEPEPQEPNVQLVSGQGFITSDVTVEPGDSLKFKVLAEKGDAKMETINFSVDNQSNIGSFPQDVPDKDQFTTIITSVAPQDENKYTYEIMVTDKDGVKGSATVTVTVDKGSSGGGISSYSAKMLMIIDDKTSKSFFNSMDGTVHSFNDIDGNSTLQGKIDFTYYYGSTDEYTICKLAKLPDGWKPGDMSSWTMNNTKFKTTSLSPSEFNNVSDASTLQSHASGASLEKATGLAADDVVAFMTESGKAGLFLVTNIQGESSAGDFIEIEVKVEQ